MKKQGTEIIAHRGFSGEYEENTLPAFKAAIDANADMIELDVHMTKDGQLVVIHDESVVRTTNGNGKVKDMTLEELQRLRIKNNLGRTINGKVPPVLEEEVPTLETVLALVKSSNIKLNIELKTDVYPYDGIEAKLIELVERYQIADRVLVSSFNHDSLKRLKQECSNSLPKDRNPYEIGVLFDETKLQSLINRRVLPLPRLDKKHIRVLEELGAQSYHPRHSNLTKGMIDYCQENKIAIRPWTVNDENRMKRLIQQGVTGLITNYPDRLRDLQQNLVNGSHQNTKQKLSNLAQKITPDILRRKVRTRSKPDSDNDRGRKL